jgi:hypothetical protein
VGPAVGSFFSTRSNPAEDPTSIANRAMLDVPVNWCARSSRRAATERLRSRRGPAGDNGCDTRTVRSDPVAEADQLTVVAACYLIVMVGAAAPSEL